MKTMNKCKRIAFGLLIGSIFGISTQSIAVSPSAIVEKAVTDAVDTAKTVNAGVQYTMKAVRAVKTGAGYVMKGGQRTMSAARHVAKYAGDAKDTAIAMDELLGVSKSIGEKIAEHPQKAKAAKWTTAAYVLWKSRNYIKAGVRQAVSTTGQVISSAVKAIPGAVTAAAVNKIVNGGPNVTINVNSATEAGRCAEQLTAEPKIVISESVPSVPHEVLELVAPQRMSIFGSVRALAMQSVALRFAAMVGKYGVEKATPMLVAAAFAVAAKTAMYAPALTAARAF